MQDALTLHGMAISDVILNDDIQEFFLKLPIDEIGYVDKIISYGKVKGWINLQPSFSQA